jgi:hypothetical protein
MLEPRSLSAAVEDGSLAHDDAIKIAMEQGYNASDAAVLVNQAAARKMASYREAVVSTAESLYEDSAISEDDAKNIAKTMGFSDAEASAIMLAAASRREAKLVTSVVSAVRGKFLARHITKAIAGGLLTAAGIPAEQRDSLTTLWLIEQSANVKVLTEAQVAKAVKTKLITPEDGLARLIAQGYSQGDAILLLEGA